MEKPIPSDPEAEEAVLGSILIDPDAIMQVSGFLKPNDFLSSVNHTIYERMLSLQDKGVPIDLVTLGAEMERCGDKTQVSYLTTLIGSTPTSINAEYYGRIVQGLSTRRQVIEAAARMTRMAYSPDGDEAETILGKAERLLSDIQLHAEKNAPRFIGETASAILDMYEAQGNGEKPDLIKTGFANLDDILKRIHRHRLIMCAGRPGMGKSATALHIAYNIAMTGKPVLVFSMEMEQFELTYRLVGINTGIDTLKVENIELLSDDERPQAICALGEIDKLPLIVRDGGRNVLEIEADIARTNMICLQKCGQPLALVVIDQLNKITRTPGSKATNRNLELEEITTRLKQMAMPDRLWTPIWLNHQLNRECEKRPGNGRPILSDLRDSGATEQDADIVVFVWPETDYLSENERVNRLKAFQEGWQPYTLIVAKNRSGPTGDAQMMWCKKSNQIRSQMNGGKK